MNRSCIVLLLLCTLAAAAPAAPAAPAARAARVAPAAPAAPVDGSVGRVVDGDTLWFTPPGKAPLVVRLLDIDAPEICQPWGQQAQRALAELALNKPATLRSVARDPHGRTLGSVTVDGVDLGPLMVAEGHAWSRRMRYDRGPLVKQERMARALGRGLHALPGNVAPWDFRKAHGPCIEGPARTGPRGPAVRQVVRWQVGPDPGVCPGRPHPASMWWRPGLPCAGLGKTRLTG